MRVPITLSISERNKLMRLHKGGATPQEITKLMGHAYEELLHIIQEFAEQEERALREAERTIMKEKDEKKLLELLEKPFTPDEIAELMDKKPSTIWTFIRDWRNNLVHNKDKMLAKEMSTKAKNRIIEIGTKLYEEWQKDQLHLLNRKKTSSKVVKTMARPRKTGRYNLATNRYVLDEWWNFGILDHTDETQTELILTSQDNNKVVLIKKFTRNWKDLRLKCKGLQGEFVTVRMVQNFETTSPRLVDISASDGLMSLAKDFPDDKRNQSFKGRYKWEYFGIYEAKKIDDKPKVYLVNDEGRVVTFPFYGTDDAQEERVEMTLDNYEGEPALICIDMKNPVDEDGYTRICDIHPEEEGYDLYASNHNVIVEQIAKAKDAAIDTQGEMSLQRDQLSEQREQLMKQAEAQARDIDKQIKKSIDAENDMRKKLEEQLQDLGEQERFLRDAKDGLHDYQVQLLARERDKAGKTTVVEMKGLRVVNPAEPSASDEMKAALKRLQDAAAKKKRRSDLTEQPIEEVPEKKESPFSGITAAMFDDRAKGEEQMPAWASTLMETVQNLGSQNAALISTFAMTDAEVQSLRDFVREEEEQLEAGNKKRVAEREDIHSRLEDIVGQTIDCKVNNGHPKNTLILRHAIDLDKQKVTDRLHIQFIKHLYQATFKVFLIHHNKEALVTIVRDSDDPADIAVKNVMSMHGEAWKKTEEEVAGFGGKRIVGKKATPAKLQKWHIEICDRLGVEVK